jgi:hypothetical protein
VPDFKADTITKLRGMTLDEVIDYTATQQADHWTHSAGMAEIARRQTEWQIKAAEAQVQAAEAEKEAARAATNAATAESDAARAAIETAAATNRNARYMLWSVIAAAVSAIASLASTAIAVFGHH